MCVQFLYAFVSKCVIYASHAMLTFSDCRLSPSLLVFLHGLLRTQQNIALERQRSSLGQGRWVGVVSSSHFVAGDSVCTVFWAA